MPCMVLCTATGQARAQQLLPEPTVCVLRQRQFCGAYTHQQWERFVMATISISRLHIVIKCITYGKQEFSKLGHKASWINEYS